MKYRAGEIVMCGHYVMRAGRPTDGDCWMACEMDGRRHYERVPETALRALTPEEIPVLAARLGDRVVLKAGRLVAAVEKRGPRTPKAPSKPKWGGDGPAELKKLLSF